MSRVLPVIGILVIVLLLVLIVSLIANTLFNQKVTKEVNEFFKDHAADKNEIVSKADLAGLPLSVQKWLEHSQVIGKPRITTVRLKQKGSMRMKEGQPWMPAEAEQYFTTDEPGFMWKVKVKAAPLLNIVGKDKYDDGQGEMLIKLLALITVADSQGKEMDQGAMLRYLAEIVWFPTAALSSYINWEENDANSAKATMSYKGVTVSGVFTFNDKGEVINFVAERYMESKGQYVLETWSTPMGNYKEFDGIRIPTTGVAVWNLKTGDFPWYRVEITEIEYNKPVVYLDI